MKTSTVFLLATLANWSAAGINGFVAYHKSPMNWIACGLFVISGCFTAASAYIAFSRGD